MLMASFDHAANVQVVRWQQMLPPLVERGRVQPCADLRSCGEFVCPWEELYGAGAEAMASDI